MELRVLAHLSGDPKLIDFFRSNEDFFSQVAGDLKGKPASSITSEERQVAKQVVYAVMYGVGPHRLGQTLGIATADAEQFVFPALNPDCALF